MTIVMKGVMKGESLLSLGYYLSASLISTQYLFSQNQKPPAARHRPFAVCALINFYLFLRSDPFTRATHVDTMYIMNILLYNIDNDIQKTIFKVHSNLIFRTHST